MKTFAATLVLFLILIIIIIVNVFYVNSVLERTRELATQIYTDSADDAALSELCEYWKKHKAVLGMSTSLRDVDSVTENLLNFRTSIIEGNDLLLEQSYALLCNSLDDIARYERISLENIF